MRKIDRLIIHCSATRPSMDIGVDDIRKWHLERGWSDIGYHYVIRRGGFIELGRQVSRPGAHAKGFNASSIGICLVGGVNPQGKPDANFTATQYAQLQDLVGQLRKEHGVPYDGDHILGHRDLPKVAKACPSFNVRAFFQL